MSDHLIAEANRHAKALTDERNNLVVELNLLREWQRETIQNERAHHAERKDAIARAERAEAELREWHLLRLWGTTPEIVHDFIKGQQSRIHAAQDIEAELAAEREKAERYRLATLRLDAELAAERARLDAGTILLNVAGERVWHCGIDLRAAIDAGIKEGSK